MHTSPESSRRRFLRAALVAGGAVLAPTLLLRADDADAFRAGLADASERRFMMGSIVGVTAVASSKAHAQDAVAAAFEAMAALLPVFDRHDDATAVAALNRHGTLANPPAELLTVLRHSRALSRHVEGAFDVTVTPVVELLRATAGVPDPKDLQNALALVNHADIRLEDDAIHLGRAGMALTLDGVAKGFIADAAAHALERAGAHGFCIDAGGDIRTAGTKANGRPWRVAVQDPDKRGRYPAVLSLTNAALATSGGYEIAFDVAGRATHLVDPRSGRSPGHVRSVSVQAPTVMEADSLATAMSVLPTREALALAEAAPRCGCLLVTTAGGVVASSRWGRAEA